MRGAFMAGPRRPAPVAALVEEPTHRRRANAEPVLRQGGRQLRATLARPPQRRRGVAASQRIDQRFQRVPEPGLRLLEERPARARAAQPVGPRACSAQQAYSVYNADS